MEREGSFHAIQAKKRYQAKPEEKDLRLSQEGTCPRSIVDKKRAPERGEKTLLRLAKREIVFQRAFDGREPGMEGSFSSNRTNNRKRKSLASGDLMTQVGSRQQFVHCWETMRLEGFHVNAGINCIEKKGILTEKAAPNRGGGKGAIGRAHKTYHRGRESLKYY